MRSGYVAVIGRANAGKSTLINVMVGEKVSIVSPKPQTTRDRILGVLTEEDYQIVFVDTPGIYKARNALTDMMMRTTETSAQNVDFLLYVVDGHDGIDEEDFALMKKYKDLVLFRTFYCSVIKTKKEAARILPNPCRLGM
jgi:GTP-binding protein Era